MASSDLIARVKFFAIKNGLDLNDYTDMKILRREREARREGMSYAEFADLLLNEVSGNQRNSFGLSKCPSCGGNTLIHEDGCMHCKSCGWSACG